MNTTQTLKHTPGCFLIFLTRTPKLERRRRCALGSAAVPAAGVGVPPTRTSRAAYLWALGLARNRKVRCGGTPQPARETRALPGRNAALPFATVDQHRSSGLSFAKFGDTQCKHPRYGAEHLFSALLSKGSAGILPAAKGDARCSQFQRSFSKRTQISRRQDAGGCRLEACAPLRDFVLNRYGAELRNTHPGAKLGLESSRIHPDSPNVFAPAKHSFEDGCVTECNSVTRH